MKILLRQQPTLVLQSCFYVIHFFYKDLMCGTERVTDRRTLLQKCEDASKNSSVALKLAVAVLNFFFYF